MEVSQEINKYRNEVEPALKSKQEEFLILGYDQFTEDDIWNYLMKKKWIKLKSELKLHEIVQQILALKIGDFMNFRTVEAFKETEFSMENQEDLMELLR